MKTAVLLSGQSRTIDQCVDSLLEFIVRPLNADVFFHFWQDSKVPPFMTQGWYHLDEDPVWEKFEGSFSRDIIKKLNPKNYMIQEQINFDDSFYAAQCTPQNSRLQAVNFQHFLSMTYSIRCANDLKKRHEFLNNFKYDCVLRVRPDMKFTDKVPSECLADLQRLYYFSDKSFGGCNDTFAVSNSKNMDDYAYCFDNVRKIFDNGCNWHPETLLKTHLLDCNVDFVGIETIGELVR
jgi:hypothetical protein